MSLYQSPIIYRDDREEDNRNKHRENERNFLVDGVFYEFYC